MRKNVLRCRQSSACGLVLLIFLVFSVACENNIVETNTNGVDNDFYALAEFDNPVSSKLVFNALNKADINRDPCIITTKYVGYQSRWIIESDSPAIQNSKLVESEIDRLDFLIENFDPEDLLEKSVHQELTHVLEQIQTDDHVNIISVAVRGRNLDVLSSYPWVSNIRIIQSNNDRNGCFGVGIRRQAITDWPDDADHIPVAGTTTIWSTGTLQKFWFDDIAIGFYEYSIEFGIEMDTVVRPYSAVTCNNGWSSNLPYAYDDTQFSDTRRNCSVGSIRANLLQTWTLYWTWKDFNSFSGNPRFDIQFQANEWCWWIDDFDECNSNRPWCMCSRFDIEWVISYYYNEAPGTEISWYRD